MRRAAGRAGATVISGEARLLLAGGQIQGAFVGTQLIEADAVVAATGAWTNEFLAQAGLSIGVAPQRGQIVHIGLGLTDTSRWQAVLPGSSGHYMLAFDDSRVVAGATRETGSGFDHRVTPGGVAEVLGQALEVAPGLAAGTYLETRIGFRPMGPDLRPLLSQGPRPGWPHRRHRARRVRAHHRLVRRRAGPRGIWISHCRWTWNLSAPSGKRTRLASHRRSCPVQLRENSDS